MLLFLPAWYLVDHKGFVYICDLQDLKIKVFDTERKFISSHRFRNRSYDVFLTTDSFYERDERISGTMHTGETEVVTGYRVFKRYRVNWHE